MPILTGYWILEATGFALLHSLWKGAVAALLYMAASGLVMYKPESRYRLAAGLSFITAGLFVVDLLSYHAQPSSANIRFLQQWMNSFNQSTLFSLAAIAYFLVLLVPVTRLANNMRWVMRIRKKDLSKAPLPARLFVQQTAFRLTIDKPVRVMLSALVPSPLTVGYLKPIILLPLSCVTALSPKQLEAVLLHELAHIKRSDYLFNLLLQVADSLLYFNPFTGYLIKQAAAERELACDGLVLRTGYEPQQYAAALVHLQKAVQPQSLALAAARRGQLLQRVQVMLGMPQPFKPNKSFIALAIFSCLFIAHLLLLKGSMQQVVTEQPIGLISFVEEQKEVNSNGYSDNIVTAPAPAAQPKKSIAASPLKNTSQLISKKQTALPVKTISVPITVEAPASSGAHFISGNASLTTAQAKEVDELLTQTKENLAAQWPQALQGFGDQLTKEEAELARKEYLTEVENLNWNFLRQQLVNQYDNIQWDKINADAEEEDEATSSLLDVLEQLANRSATENFPDRSVKTAEALQQQLVDALKTLQGLEKKKVKL